MKNSSQSADDDVERLKIVLKFGFVVTVFIR